MNEATIALVVMSILILIIFLGFLIWGWKSGQFKKIEDAKYQLFESEKKTESKNPADASPEDGEKKC